MRSLPLFAGILGIAIANQLWSSAASACSCRPPAPPDMALAEADLVFEGRTFASSPADDDQIHWEFEVLRYWKGEPARTITIVSAASSATCGRTYEAGTSYLIYAQGQEEPFHDNLCSRTRPIGAATDDLEVLGEGRQPKVEPAIETPINTDREPPRISAPPPEPPPAQPGPRGCAVDPVRSAGSVPWIIAAVAFFRRRAVASPEPTR